MQWDRALCLALYNWQKSDATVSCIRRAWSNAKYGDVEPLSYERSDLFIKIDIQLGRRLCRGRHRTSQQRVLHSKVHGLKSDRSTHGAEYLGDSCQEVQNSKIRCAPPIRLPHMSRRIGKERMDVIIVNNRTDMLDLERLLVRVKMLKFNDIQQIGDSKNQRGTIGHVARDK